MTPTWTVAICTVGQRRNQLARLLAGLMPQVDAAGGRVKVIAFWDNGETPLADKRQALVEATTTDYLSFVDDDDTVTDDYVPTILEALESWPDFVGLWMQVYRDGVPLKPAELSLKYDGWFEQPDRYCRDITHENPMRTSILRMVDFRDKPSDQPEDTPWAAKLRGKVKTEVMVDRVLYNYWWIPKGSLWGINLKRLTPTDQRGRPWRRLDVASPHFSWVA